MWAWLLCAAALLVMLVRWRRSGLTFLDYLGMAFFTAYGRLWHGCVGNNFTPVPWRGPALLYANHTCSTDPIFLACLHPRPISFMIAREYYAIPALGPLFRRMGCVPVQRKLCDTAAVRVGLRRLSEGRILCIFPEGGLSNAGKLRPRRGKAGVGLLALRSTAPVIPVRITRGPQTHRILPAWLRPSRARVTFGAPVDLSAYRGRRITRRLVEEVATHLMQQVAALDPTPRCHTRRKP